MTMLISPAASAVVVPSEARSTARSYRTVQRRLREQDRRSAHLAELHAMVSLLERAVVELERGWVQGVWSRPFGPPSSALPGASVLRVGVAGSGPGVCLVGAVVRAAGGRRAVPTQLLQRTLDLTWHTLRRHPDEPVSWCSGPSARQAHVRDLTRWNDHPARRRDDVTGLLGAAHGTVGREARSVFG